MLDLGALTESIGVKFVDSKGKGCYTQYKLATLGMSPGNLLQLGLSQNAKNERGYER
jgi:hypothetical protein